MIRFSWLDELIPLLFSFAVPPEQVVIEGPREVQTDHTYTYRCEAKNANPAPRVQWIINGVVTTAGVSTQTHPPPPKPSGYVSMHHPTGWRVTSDLILKVMEEDAEIAVTCNAISHGHHGDTMLRKAERLLTVLRKNSNLSRLPQCRNLKDFYHHSDFTWNQYQAFALIFRVFKRAATVQSI